jgi:hypothetical protein
MQNEYIPWDFDDEFFVTGTAWDFQKNYNSLAAYASSPDDSNEYYFYPYGFYNHPNEFYGHANYHNSYSPLGDATWNSPGAYSVKAVPQSNPPVPEFPAGVLIKAGAGVDTPFLIYGVVIRPRADLPNQYVNASHIKIAVGGEGCAGATLGFATTSEFQGDPVDYPFTIYPSSDEAGAYALVFKEPQPHGAVWVLVTIEESPNAYNEWPSMRVGLLHESYIENA